VVEELRNRAIEGLLSLPKRGREIGGLLLGKIEPGNVAAVSIEAAREIPCEHRFGPSYVLSAPDRGLLGSELARARPEASLAVIGLYRSYCRRELALDAPDRDLIQKFFGQGDSVFLLLEPVPSGECLAAFAFPHDGQVPAEPPYPPFRFEAEELAAGEQSAPAQPAAPAPVPRTARRKHFWLPLIACIAASIGAALIYELWKMASEPQFAVLHLDASQNAGQLQLAWNRLAPPVILASHGVLLVTDGPSQKRIQLSAADLRSGKYLYRPEHPDVLFHIAIYGPAVKPWSDSLRVMSVASSPALPAASRPQSTIAETAPEPARPSPHSGEASRVAEPRVAATVPVAVHEVQPTIPDGIRSRIESPVVVPVEVHISESGRVTSAVSSSSGDGLYRYLADEAVTAARSWQFTPARARDGRPVASSKTIEFVFRQ